MVVCAPLHLVQVPIPYSDVNFDNDQSTMRLPKSSNKFQVKCVKIVETFLAFIVYMYIYLLLFLIIFLLIDQH
jgi:hypothetical protein